MSTFSRFWVDIADCGAGRGLLDGHASAGVFSDQHRLWRNAVQVSHRARAIAIHKRKRSRGANDSEETGAPSKEKSDRILASLGAPSSAEQSAVLKSVVASPVLGVVGSTKDLQDVGRPASKEDDRDYTGSLDKILARLAGAQDRGIATPGDVTASGIELSLGRAIKDSNLDAFERFALESWTSDRVRKLVLDRTLMSLDSVAGRKFSGRVRMRGVDGKI